MNTSDSEFINLVQTLIQSASSLTLHREVQNAMRLNSYIREDVHQIQLVCTQLEDKLMNNKQ